MDTIKYFIKEYEKELDKNYISFCKEYFDQIAYERWGLVELLKYIEENKTKPITLAVEEFAHKMDAYSLVNSKTSYMFSCAYDACINVLDILLTEEEK